MILSITPSSHSTTIEGHCPATKFHQVTDPPKTT